MWEPQRLKNLRASTSCYGNRCTFNLLYTATILLTQIPSHFLSVDRGRYFPVVLTSAKPLINHSIPRTAVLCKLDKLVSWTLLRYPLLKLLIHICCWLHRRRLCLTFSPCCQEPHKVLILAPLFFINFISTVCFEIHFSEFILITNGLKVFRVLKSAEGFESL
jgi:hypothetical protein